MNYTDVEVFWL